VSEFKNIAKRIQNKTFIDIRARIGPMMRSPRLLVTGRAPKSPSNPRAHHWATLTCHSCHNTRASLHTIKSISKAWSTKSQQDWSINVTINNRLLACKAELWQALYYVKPALRVDPYLQVLALAQFISSLTFINQLYSNHYTSSFHLTNQARVTNK
jgi:hypothetical protein